MNRDKIRQRDNTIVKQFTVPTIIYEGLIGEISILLICFDGIHQLNCCCYMILFDIREIRLRRACQPIDRGSK